MRLESIKGGGIIIKITYLYPFVFILLMACSTSNSSSYISLTTSELNKEQETFIENDNTIKVAFASVVSPQETRNKYNLLIDYLKNTLSREIEIIQKQTYDEVNVLLKDGEVDLAFICSLSYVIGTEEGYMIDIASPVVNGKNVYQAYVITHKNSSIENLEDGKGSRAAFVDPYSYTGKLALQDLIIQSNNDPNTFFEKTFYTYSHDYSVSAVARGAVDIATIDSILFDQLIELGNEDAKQTKIIDFGPFAGSPPIVVSSKTDPELKKDIQNVLLTLHHHSAGRNILKELKIDHYVPIDRSSYEPIRKLLPLLGEDQ
ncbi:phosphate/phosphite/phosphonate ABC transporter substrate-binding protein [Evansella sp. AB-P1]|uniref:substrate-binding domain-containing protein n=1 Tax=Evansella sp. AB-P1 TaxID=3037653 RepID=UPI00241FAA51|nr:phosphate/phosphite/phosphonate ABC transporter substrate-binding protein [Evansella sp. AB-P1]MDG5786095.1 phosphate/phosphite/phosphonate ABC transporter substrate-binding protein [Evansella sp. AB-P1]